MPHQGMQMLKCMTCVHNFTVDWAHGQKRGNQHFIFFIFPMLVLIEFLSKHVLKGMNDFWNHIHYVTVEWTRITVLRINVSSVSVYLYMAPLASTMLEGSNMCFFILWFAPIQLRYFPWISHTSSEGNVASVKNENMLKSSGKLC